MNTYQTLSDDELIEAWLEAFRKLAENFNDSERRAAVSLMGEEFARRGLKQPYAHVTKEAGIIRRHLDAAAQAKAAEAADRLQKVLEGLEAELTRFVAARNSGAT